MSDPVRNTLPDEEQRLQGLPVPQPHNDVRPTPVQSGTAGEPQFAWWPVLVIILGLFVTLAWLSLLGWLVFQFAGWQLR